MTLFQVTLDLSSAASSQGLSGSDQSFGGFIGSVLTIVLTLAVLLLFLYLIWGAISWMSAGGDSSKVQQARDRMTQAVIGLIVLLSTVAIMQLLQSFFGLSILTFPGTTPAPRAETPRDGCVQTMYVVKGSGAKRRTV